MPKQAFIATFYCSKNLLEAIEPLGSPGSFQIICGVKYLKKRSPDLSTTLIQNVSVSRSSLKHNLSPYSLMTDSPAVICRGSPFIKSRKKSYHLNSFKRLTKTTIFS